MLITDKIQVSLRDLEEHWSIDDLQDAHEVLDALEEAEALQARKANP